MAKAGLWLANGAPIDPDKMLGWRPGAVCCFMDYLAANQVAQYHADNPDAPVIIRFQHPQNWWQSPAESAVSQFNYVISKWPEIKDLSPYVYFWNELNLHYENGDTNPDNQGNYETPAWYEKVADWTLDVADRIKQRVPDMRLVCPPFAFGHHEDGAPDDQGNPKDGWAGYDYLAETVRSHFDKIITFHAYWGDASGSILARLYDEEESSWYAFRWRRVRKLFQARYGFTPQFIIDEAGNFGASDIDFTDQCAYYATETLMDPGVLALCFFLWQDPTNSPGNLPNSWVQRCQNLDQHIAVLGALDVQPGVTIRVLVDGKVQTLPLEEYLRGVVPAEIYPTSPMDALKAQAVWARSYALWRIANPRGASYDLYDDTRDQVWNPSLIHTRCDQAVRETAGMALVQNGAVFQAQYVSKCGRVVCPYCLGATGYHGQTWEGRACQEGAIVMAQRGDTWQTISVAYYEQEVVLSDIDAPIPDEEPAGDGDQPSGEDEIMWDPNLNAYSEANGHVTGVKCIIEPHDTIRTKFGNPVLPVGGWYWKCVSGAFIGDQFSENLHDITMSMVDENGAPFPGAVWHAYPTAKMAASNWATAFDNGGGPGQVFNYPTGSGSIAMGANDFKPKEGQIGPYIVGVYSPAETGGAISSELVFGMGMPYSRHVRFAFVFQRTKLGTTPEPTPGGTGCNLAAAISAFFDALKG